MPGKGSNNTNNLKKKLDDIFDEVDDEIEGSDLDQKSIVNDLSNYARKLSERSQSINPQTKTLDDEDEFGFGENDDFDPSKIQTKPAPRKRRSLIIEGVETGKKNTPKVKEEIVNIPLQEVEDNSKKKPVLKTDDAELASLYSEDDGLLQEMDGDYSINSYSDIDEPFEIKETEEPKVDNKAPKVDDTPKEPENLADKYKLSDADKEAFNIKLNNYNTLTNQNVTDSRLQEIKSSLIDGDMSKTPAFLRNEKFNEQFAQYYKKELANALKANANLRNEGKPALSVVDTTKQVDDYMRANYEALKDSGVIGEDIEFQPNGGLLPEEIRDMQTNAYNSLSEDKQTAKEKKAIANSFANNKKDQIKNNDEKFNTLVDDINSHCNVQFNAKGIETYLNARWKESSGKDIAAQRESFKKEFTEFAKAAYQKMSEKMTYNTDCVAKKQNFETFCSGMEKMCKQNGWMDKDAPHMLFGGLDAKSMSDIDKTCINNMPKNMNEWCQEQVKQLNEKNYDGMPKYVKNIMENIPKSTETSLDNTKVREAIGFIRGLDQLHSSRSIGWKIRHPILNSRENKAISDLKDNLEAKGYKNVVDYISKNPLKSENDFYAKKYEQLCQSQDKNFKENEKIIGKDITNNNNEVTRGTRISVPQADNTKEIVNPEVKSPKVTLEAKKTLDKKGPEMNDSKG